MSNSPSDKKSNQKPDIQFTTGNIGRWSSRQEDPFAEQNRKRAAKKQTRNVKRQKVAPIIVIIAGVILTAAAIIGLIFLIIHLSHRTVNEIPEINGSTTQDIADYRDLLQNFYNQRPSDATEEEKLQAVQDAVNSTLDTAGGRENEVAVKIAQASFYIDNSRYEDALRVADSISHSVDALDLDQQILYYSILYISYYKVGNQEKGDEYSAKVSDLIGEQQGWIGDDQPGWED